MDVRLEAVIIVEVDAGAVAIEARISIAGRQRHAKAPNAEHDAHAP